MCFVIRYISVLSFLLLNAFLCMEAEEMNFKDLVRANGLPMLWAQKIVAGDDLDVEIHDARWIKSWDDLMGKEGAIFVYFPTERVRIYVESEWKIREESDIELPKAIVIEDVTNIVFISVEKSREGNIRSIKFDEARSITLHPFGL